MSNYPPQVDRPERKRRSDRHKTPEEQVNQGTARRPNYQPDSGRVPLPMSDSYPPQRSAPTVYDYDRYPPNTRFDQQVEEDDDYDYAPRRWPFVLLGLVLVLLALVASLYFLVPKDATGLLGSARAPVAGVIDKVLGIDSQAVPKLIKFETAEPYGVTGVRTVFTFTTDIAVDDVRLQDENGNVLSSATAAKDEQRTVWTATIVFDEPFEGAVFANVLKDGKWLSESKSVMLGITAPTPVPTPIPTQPPITQPPVTGQPAAVVLPQNTPQPVVTAQAAQQQQPTSAPQAVYTAPPFIPPVTVVTAQPQPQPTQVVEVAEVVIDELPDDMDEVGETPDDFVETAENIPGDDIIEQPADVQPVAQAVPAQPAATPMPVLTAEATDSTAPGKLKYTDTTYLAARKQKDFTRQDPINVPGQYTSYEGGVFTFRGDGFRRNAAFGDVDVRLQELSIAWQTELGSLRTEDSGRVHGVGWTGQPAIVKWSKELRLAMNINEEKKAVSPLKEVIFAGQDGKVYFLDLDDGVPSREPIDVGFPLKGSVAVDPQGQPLIAFGQGISKLPGKTGAIGLYIYNLLDQKQLYFINGRRTDKQSQYSTNGAFDGTPLFDRSSDTMVVAGENGLLYTAKLNTKFDYANQESMSLAISPEIHYLKSKGNQKDASVSMEASAAMYMGYAFLADKQGFVRCVDTNTMQTVWAVDTGDNTDATPALDFNQDGSLSLYTGNTVFTRLKGKKTATIRSLNAMTGEENWQYTLGVAFDQSERSGVKASPVVGDKSISSLVIFTVNKVEEGGGVIVALDKQTGNEVWKTPLTAGAISSPVAVYNAQGDAWIIQGDEKGRLTMMKGLTGEVVNTLQLEGDIEGSPAVYNDMLVIGTSSDKPLMYGIRIE